MPSNSSTCSTINQYGGTTTPLYPGESLIQDVTFRNVGSVSASGVTFVAGVCASSPSTGTPTPTNLCTAANELTIDIRCSPGNTFSAATAWTDLSYGPAVPPPTNTVRKHAASGADLAVNASWTCRTTVALNANASIASQNVTVTQSLAWVLSA